MADPTDLIREADAALDGITPAPWKIDEYDEGPLASIVSVADDRIGGWVEVAKSMDCDARFAAAAPDLVRRLRDALATALDDNRTLADATIAALHAQVEHEGHQADVERFKAVEATAELVKAQETISRVREACDYLEDGPTRAAVRHIRRAIEGEAT